MPDSYWFASVLIDPEGHWRGRFLRAIPPATDRDAPIAWLLDEIGDAEPQSADDLIFLPSTVLGETTTVGVVGWAGSSDASTATPPCLWLDSDAAPDAQRSFVAASIATSPAPGHTLVTNAMRIVVDTGCRTGWQFAAFGRNTLADIGHLQHRRPLPGSESDRAKPQLLSLLALITRDAETHELEKAFRTDPELAYHLLRLVNSVGMGLTHPVKSLGHAITVVGRRQLQRWLQLLIYANTAAGRGKPNPLLQLAAYRGRLLELLATPGRDPDSAYMVGIFSLLDRILPKKMNEILAKLPIQATVRDALCSRSGYLGKLLGACEAAEIGRLEQSTGALRELEVEPLKWLRCQHIAYGWAHAIGRELIKPDA